MSDSSKICALIDPQRCPKDLKDKFETLDIIIGREFAKVFAEILEHKIEVLLLHEDYYKKFKLQFKKLAKRLNIQLSTIIFCERNSNITITDTDIKELEIASILLLPDESDKLDIVLSTSKNLMRYKNIVNNNKKELEIYKDTIKTLNEIGLALSREKELDTLLNVILSKIRRLTNSDSGSIFIIDNRETLTKEERIRANRIGHVEQKNLYFKIAQNDSSSFPFKEQKMPISKKSIAGWVAIKSVPLVIDDVYNISDAEDYTFNTSFDHTSGYKSRSMLVLPMKNHKEEIVGIIQLINRKKNRHIILDSETDVEKYVIPYDPELEALTMSVASQAAVAIENLQLIQNINNMVEGFVTASVTAIEQRDPTSGGHSERVSLLSVRIAEEINNIDTGRFRNIFFNMEQLREIKYAALLHDFGKVGVREQVLTKGRKLYKWELELIKERFGFLKEYIKSNSALKEIEYMKNHPREMWAEYTEKLEEEVKKRLNQIEFYYNFILEKNNPCYMNKEDIRKIQEVSEINFTDVNGKMRPLLREKEIINLEIPKGTLNDDERKQINDHVVHSYNFLIKIPWLKSLKNVPEIAYGHHEKLDGTGYPRGIAHGRISLQSKILTVCDIFDALTASDRPYRFAISIEKAIHILELNAEELLIDRDLVDLFRAKKVYRSVSLY